MLYILDALTPRFVPFQRAHVVATVYTDTFFELGDKVWRPLDADMPSHLSLRDCCRSLNGWGFLVRIGFHVSFGHGCVSTGLLQRFCSRRAFIYFLEIYAQLLAFCAHVEALPAYWLSYIDNQPGLVALQKGYGRDDCINMIVTSFWVLATHQRWVPEFRWVPSSLNIADPRGDMSIMQPSWRRLVTDSSQLEAVLLQFTHETMGDFPAAVKALQWQWSTDGPPFGGVVAPSDGDGHPLTTLHVTHPDTDTRHANYEEENDRIRSSQSSSERSMS